MPFHMRGAVWANLIEKPEAAFLANARLPDFFAFGGIGAPAVEKLVKIGENYFNMGKFNYDQNDFEKVKSEAEKFYETIGEVWCPYFKENIAFNAKGIRHLKFKSDERARPEKDQYARLKLLRYAPDIIKNSRTLQGIEKTRDFEKEKSNGKWKYTMKDVVFFEFIAVVDNVRVKVIVKEVFGGEKHFWSVIPFWKIDKENGKRVLCGGDALED